MGWAEEEDPAVEKQEIWEEILSCQSPGCCCCTPSTQEAEAEGPCEFEAGLATEVSKMEFFSDHVSVGENCTVGNSSKGDRKEIVRGHGSPGTGKVRRKGQWEVREQRRRGFGGMSVLLP